MTTLSTTNPTVPPPPPGGPAPRRPAQGPSGFRRPVLGLTIALVGIILAAVAWGGSGGSGEESATLRPTEPVDRIELTAGAGTIEIVPGEEVLVEATSHSDRGGAGVVVDSELTAGQLELDVSCARRTLFRSCRTSVRLVVPPGTAVLASTEAGAITATGLSGGVDLNTDAGAIDVDRLDGDIRLRSEAGIIRGTVLRGDVDAATSTGVIAITVIEDLTRLSATTEAGRIDLIVPDAPYRIEAGTVLGRTDIEVAHTDGASRLIEARSEVGTVTIRTAARDD